MLVVLSKHALKRLNDKRQKGIAVYDVLKAATAIPGFISKTTRFKGFRSQGKPFDLVLVDKNKPKKRIIVTVIGED